MYETDDRCACVFFCVVVLHVVGRVHTICLGITQEHVEELCLFILHNAQGRPTSM